MKLERYLFSLRRTTTLPSPSNPWGFGHILEPVAVHQIRRISCQRCHNSLRAVVPSDPALAHAVVCHQSQLNVRDTQSKESAEGVVDVFSSND